MGQSLGRRQVVGTLCLEGGYILVGVIYIDLLYPGGIDGDPGVACVGLAGFEFLEGDIPEVISCRAGVGLIVFFEVLLTPGVFDGSFIS